jgi:hypothetical protein
VSLQDEHVEDLDLGDDPELVGIEVYVTSARRAYAIADRYRALGARVVLGRDFYSWGAIVRGAATKPDLAGSLRHLAYAVGWKKCEPVWDLLIRARRVGRALPLLERVLAGPSPAPCRGEDPEGRASYAPSALAG